MELDGGKADFVYEFNEWRTRSETLAILRKTDSWEPEFKKYLWPVVLSDRPVGRDRRDPPVPRFVITDVDFELKASAGDDAKLSVVETIVPVGVRPVRLRLRPRLGALRGLGRDGRDALRARLVSVTDETGRRFRFDHTNNDLLVATAASPRRLTGR